MAFRTLTVCWLGAAIACSSVAGRAGDSAPVREQDARAAGLAEAAARRAASAALAQERRYSARLAQALQETHAGPRSIAAEHQGAPGPFDDLIGALRAQIEAGELQVRRSAVEIRITLDERVHFLSGSAELSESGRNALARLAPALAKFPGHQIIVEGHADNNPIVGPLRERYATNWELAAARAVAVARYLTESGALAPESVAAVSSGEHKPAASNRTAAGRAENRRIELIIARAVTPAPVPAAEQPRPPEQSRARPRPQRATASRRANSEARPPTTNTPAPAARAANTGAAAAAPAAAVAPLPADSSPTAAQAPAEDEVDLRR